MDLKIVDRNGRYRNSQLKLSPRKAGYGENKLGGFVVPPGGSITHQHGKPFLASPAEASEVLPDDTPSLWSPWTVETGVAFHGEGLLLSTADDEGGQALEDAIEWRGQQQADADVRAESAKKSGAELVTNVILPIAAAVSVLALVLGLLFAAVQGGGRII